MAAFTLLRNPAHLIVSPVRFHPRLNSIIVSMTINVIAAHSRVVASFRFYVLITTCKPLSLNEYECVYVCMCFRVRVCMRVHVWGSYHMT